MAGPRGGRALDLLGARVATALEPHSPAAGVYLNFTSDDGEPRVRNAFGRKYARLAEAKRRWEPDNVLRYNKNILPAQAR